MELTEGKRLERKLRERQKKERGRASTPASCTPWGPLEPGLQQKSTDGLHWGPCGLAGVIALSSHGRIAPRNLSDNAYWLYCHCLLTVQTATEGAPQGSRRIKRSVDDGDALEMVKAPASREVSGPGWPV